MLRRTINIIIEMHEDGSVRIDSMEVESGCRAYLRANDPTDERIANMFGNEVYSWVLLMRDEMGDTNG